MKLKHLTPFIVLALALPAVMSQGAINSHPDKRWAYAEGTEVDENKMRQAPGFLEGAIRRENSCIFNGTEYYEGSVKDVGSPAYIYDQDSGELEEKTFEEGGWYKDPEVCLNIPGEGDDVSSGVRSSDNYFGQDWGGEWYDLDQAITNEYVRDNEDDILVDEWKEYVDFNPDVQADPSTGVINEESSGYAQGLAMEDDCSTDLPCEDIGSGVGNDGPFHANFTEGAFDDDHTEFGSNNLLETNINNYHNRVQAGGETGHQGQAATTRTYTVDRTYEWNEGSHSDTEAENGNLILASTGTQMVWNEGDIITDYAYDTGGGYIEDIELFNNHIFVGQEESPAGSDPGGVIFKMDRTVDSGDRHADIEWTTTGLGNAIYDIEMDSNVPGNMEFAYDNDPGVGRIDSSNGDLTDTFGGPKSGLARQIIYYSGDTGTSDGYLYDPPQSDGIRVSSSAITDAVPGRPAAYGTGNGEVGLGDDNNQDWENNPFSTTTSVARGSATNTIVAGSSSGDVVIYNESGNRFMDYSSLDSAVQVADFPGEKVVAGDNDEIAIIDISTQSASTEFAVRNGMRDLEVYSQDVMYGADGNAVIKYSKEEAEGYASQGTYTSKSFDSQEQERWSDIFLDYSLNTESADLEVEYSDSSSFNSISGSQSFNLDGTSNFNLDNSAQYARFKITPSSSGGSETPEIHEVEITAATPSEAAADGGGNSQDQETDLTLDWSENSHINPEDDEWALTPSLSYGIANNGTPFPPNKCYGAPREQGVTKNKRDAVYANSFVNASQVYNQGFSNPAYFSSFGLPESQAREKAKDGNWVNPDNEWRAAALGGLSCDLTGDDWGFGNANESGTGLTCRSGDCDKEGDPVNAEQNGFDPDNPHSVAAPSSDLNFDTNSDPQGYPQDNLQQYPSACGDDQGEYLIREHAATLGGEDEPNLAGRSDYYACADRPTDCVYRGEIYSQGQLVDISEEGSGENGVNSYDTEICVDIDPDIPGGEWIDPENEDARDILIGDGTATNPEYYVRTAGPFESAPGNVTWHTSSNPAVQEAIDSPYSEVGKDGYTSGYALEDDCDRALVGTDSGCDDSGYQETRGTDDDWQWNPGDGSDLVYSPFIEGMAEDDGNVFDGVASRMWVSSGSTADISSAHGASTGQDQENVDGVTFDSSGNFPTSNLNDSTIDPLEDTWAIAAEGNAVGPTGRVWNNGSCYGPLANESSGNATTKDRKVVGNSFAKAMNADGDSRLEGVWVDPDSTPRTTEYGGISCDLNLTDWGMGYNTGSGLEVRLDDSEQLYEADDPHAVTGDITFDINSDPNGVGASDNLQQYPNACGDDKNEYLIREHTDSLQNTEQDPQLTRDNIYVCADRISDCAYRGEVYSQGQMVDISDQGQQEAGVDSVDEEVCVDLDKSVPGGEWIDVDNETINTALKGDNYVEDDPSTYQGIVRDHSEYSGDGQVWFTDEIDAADEVERSPYNPLTYSDGYALEDDCADNIQYCADEGYSEQHFTPPAVYSFFEEGRREDDSNVFDGRSVQMYVGYANGTAFNSHGKSNGQDEENTDGVTFDSSDNFPTANLNDSTIDPLEDTWALSANLQDPVGPTGKVWEEGKCYGKNPWLDSSIDAIEKDEKVVANSLALAVDVNGYPYSEKKGVWVNPDSSPKSASMAHTFCDLNTTDWGYGFNSDADPEVELQYTRETDDIEGTAEDESGHAVATFVNQQTGATHTVTNRSYSSTTFFGQNYSMWRVDGYKQGVDGPASVVLKEGNQSPPDDELYPFDCENYNAADDEIKFCSKSDSHTFSTDSGVPLSVYNGSGTSTGQVRGEGYVADNPHVVVGEVTFDINSDPNGIGSDDNLPQYPNACGDDKNEYLIREHSDSVQDTEQDPALNRDDIYVCADRPTDCAYKGEVYGQGQLVDISNAGENEETGVNSVDEEVCVDMDKSIPGGEWVDVDNESINEVLKGDSYTEDDPSTYLGVVRENSSYSGNGVKWFTDNYEPASEVQKSPYNPLDYSDGYALEDDCAVNVEYCEDSGVDETHFEPDAVYSFFEEGRREDDSNVFEGRSVQMYVGYANGTAFSDHGKSNSQDEENIGDTQFDSTDYGFPTARLNDSTINELEDTWAISANLSWPVGPTGKVWKNGSCYGANPWLNDSIQSVDKSQKVVANSYAMAVDVNGYPHSEKKGVWVNPDSAVESALVGHTFCDLNATDWGYGYNRGDGTTLTVVNGSGTDAGDVRQQGYSQDNPHVVTGDITFDINSDPVGRGESENLPQYPGACGDDKNEYLIREHSSQSGQSEHNPDLQRDNIYVCADRITDCAYHGEVYSMGQTKDVSTDDEERGVNSEDAEVCADIDKDIPGGEWVDPDNASIQSTIIGSGTPEQPSTYDGFVTFENASGGVHWFNTSWGENKEYPIREAYLSPYNPVSFPAGYAFEDDVGDNVTWAEDSGSEETRKEGVAVYSPFVSGEKADDGNVGDGYVVRTYVDGSAEHGSYNSQQFENNESPLAPLNDTRIDPNEDTWAIASKPYYAVGPTGEVYPNGSCYGSSNPNYKGDTVMANSYALAHDVDGDGQKEGDWVNPDEYPSSVLTGLDTCEIKNVSDWGIGFNEGPGSDLTWSQGTPRERGYNDSADWQFHIVSGPISFDSRNDPGSMEQNDSSQYPENCGDDQNEHLIREHGSYDVEDEHEPQLQRDNIYGCADRTTDCVFNGSVYSEGQLADVSRPDNEAGSNSSDLDVCIDTDKRIPGGEWHDVDNTTWRDYLVGADDPNWDYQEDNVSSYKRLVEPEQGNRWFTDNTSAAAEVELSPYNPLNYSDGYALEDDVDPDLAYTADIGDGRQYKPGNAAYSAFEEDTGEDDSNIFQGKAVRMYVGYANGTANASHGATNDQSEENAGDLDFSTTKWGYTINLTDSTIDRREDTWALADNTSDLVGPTGKIYEPGQCYGANTSTIMEDSIRKNETVMANSFAMALEVNGDGNKEGVWINPDSTEKSLTQGNFSCEMNSTDWGIGYNTGVEGRNSHGDATLDVHHGDARSPGYEVDDIHAVSGPITFDYQSDPPGVDQDNKKQYPGACGDDQGEFLIREHRTDNGNEYNVNLNRDNIYVCADRQTDCAYNGYVFSEGDTVDISSLAAPAEKPERGDDISDEEICLDLDKSIPGGEWYDKDSNFTVKSRITELSQNSSIEEGPDGDGCLYTLSGEVSGASTEGDVVIQDSSTTIATNGSFSMQAGLACGTTQVIEYQENGETAVEKRLALPGGAETIENIRIDVNSALDPQKAWNRIKANEDHDFGVNPGTDWKNQTHKLEKEELGYFNRTGSYSAEYTTYAPEGYATEDDCGEILQENGTGPCGDVGDETQNYSWFSAGNFSYNEPTSKEGALQDNYDTTNYDYYGVHNKIDDSSNQFQVTSESDPGGGSEPPAETMRNWNLTDVYGTGYKVYDSEDSTAGPDKWALTRYRNYSVDNRGNGYRPGTEYRSGCYYRDGVAPRTDILDEGVTKKDKVFGNSWANASDYDNDGMVEGVWEDPDEIPPKFANFSCDITGPDKGYGHDDGTDDGSFRYKNNDKSTHAVIGDIAFSTVEGKTGSFAQEPPVCGDDHKEYLIEELGAADNSLEDTGRWGCGTDYDDCVSREGGEYAIYRKGDVVNTGEAAEDFGRVKKDKEICQQKPSDQFGVWYDQDYSKDFCQANNLYGSVGVRWINESYVNNNPHAVAEGINDDLNPYLAKRGEGDVESTQGDVQKYNDNGQLDGQTPVPTGKFAGNRSVDQYYTNYASWNMPTEYLNMSVSKGFCGGDEQGENVIVQQSSTELLETNYSVIAVADSEDDCVLDGAHYDSVANNDRKIYSTGENVTLDLGASERTAACFGGRWYSEWPVVFLQDEVEIEEGTERDITFKVINVESERRSFDIELEADNQIERFTEFNSFNGSEFRAAVPGGSSRQYTVEVYGQDPSLGPANISVRASAVTGTIDGTDNVEVDVVSGGTVSTQGTGETSEVPGMGGIQLIILMLLASTVYYTRLWD